MKKSSRVGKDLGIGIIWGGIIIIIIIITGYSLPLIPSAHSTICLVVVEIC